MSSRWCLSAPLPPTELMYALCPGFNSSIVMFFSSRISFYVIGLSRNTLNKTKFSMSCSSS